MSTKINEHRDFKFGSKTQGKYQNNLTVFEREHQIIYMCIEIAIKI